MNILLTADPEIPVPPLLYGGIERIIDMLIDGYVARGHTVTLLAHRDSQVPCRHVPWKAAKSAGLRNTFENTRQLYREAVQGNYDLIHSFSRLAYLLPLLPARIPKVMSYQREPTLTQVRKAVKLARTGSLTFTGCSNYISAQIKPFASAVTVYNGVDLSKYTFANSVDDDAPMVFLGRIEPIKGAHIAVKIAQHSGRKLIIAGNIPATAEKYFDEQIRPALNSNIQYVGPVNDQQKSDLLSKALCFLMPIEWNEPFGIVMVEAMACGTPVFGFARGAVPEVVENGINGYSCTTFDDLVKAVNNVNAISRISVLESVKRSFSKDVIVQDYLNIYEQMLRKHRTSLQG